MKLRGLIQNKSVWLKAGLFLLIMFFTTISSIALWYLIDGGQSINSLKLMQLLQTVGTFMLPCFIGAYLWSEKPLEWLHLTTPIHFKESLMVVLLMICASPCINLLAYINEQMVLPDFLSDLEALMKSQEEAAQKLTEQFLIADKWSVLLFNLLLMALLPAMSEELCFRGTLQSFFEGEGKKNTTAAIWVAAIIFSAIHFQFYGFLPRMLIGALFGYMLVWSGSLWLPILAHFTNNTMAVLLYYVCYNRGINMESVDALGTADTLYLGLISMAVTAGGIYFLRKSLKASKQ